MIVVLVDHFLGTLCALGYDFYDLLVDFAGHLFRVRFEIFGVLETNVSDLLAHSKLYDDIVSDFVRFFQVIRCSVSYLTEKSLLRTPTSKNETNSVNKLRSCMKFSFIAKILCKTQ